MLYERTMDILVEARNALERALIDRAHIQVVISDIDNHLDFLDMVDGEDTMKREDFVDALENLADRVEGEVRADYSGRVMYGKTCYAIVSDAPLIKLCLVVGRCGLPDPRVDQMGLGHVLYWPEYETEEE